MNLRTGVLLCLIGSTACTQNQEPRDPSTVESASAREAANPEMRPASLENASAENRSAANAPPARHDAEPATQPAPPRPEPPRTTDTERRNSAADSSAPRNAPAPVQPDNTKVNERDRNPEALTPLDQNNNATDLQITQSIRQAVMGDKSLSFTAKNVKIITQKGKVTLRGPVKTKQERDAIDAAARKVAGATLVDNQIEVKE